MAGYIFFSSNAVLESKFTLKPKKSVCVDSGISHSLWIMSLLNVYIFFVSFIIHYSSHNSIHFHEEFFGNSFCLTRTDFPAALRAYLGFAALGLGLREGWGGGA